MEWEIQISLFVGSPPRGKWLSFGSLLGVLARVAWAEHIEVCVYFWKVEGGSQIYLYVRSPPRGKWLSFRSLFGRLGASGLGRTYTSMCLFLENGGGKAGRKEGREKGGQEERRSGRKEGWEKGGLGERRAGRKEGRESIFF